MIQAPLYPSATSSGERVSSLVMTTNLPSNFSAPYHLLPDMRTDTRIGVKAFEL
jgi:hypothetical protein